MSYRKACSAAVVGALGLLATSHVQAMTMADLVGSTTPVVSGDKVYTNFSYLSAQLPADQVAVSFVPSVGVQFGASWNTALIPGPVDSVIGYNIATADNSGNVISGVNLAMGGVVTSGGGVASVGETVYDNYGHNYNLSVYSDGAGGAADNFTDSVALDPAVASLRVVKDITVTPNGANNTSYASVTFVENTYTQTPGGVGASIPEPMSLALLPLGLVGLSLRRKLARKIA